MGRLSDLVQTAWRSESKRVAALPLRGCGLRHTGPCPAEDWFKKKGPGSCG